jgi:hypothetical protein
MKNSEITEISITGAAFPNEGGLIIHPKDQKISFAYCHKFKGKHVSLFLTNGVIHDPDLEIIINKSELKKVLEFLISEEIPPRANIPISDLTQPI